LTAHTNSTAAATTSSITNKPDDHEGGVTTLAGKGGGLFPFGSLGQMLFATWEIKSGNDYCVVEGNCVQGKWVSGCHQSFPELLNTSQRYYR
jgi:hypothetical protein